VNARRSASAGVNHSAATVSLPSAARTCASSAVAPSLEPVDSVLSSPGVDIVRGARAR
jgi:hypothetical protein